MSDCDFFIGSQWLALWHVGIYEPTQCHTMCHRQWLVAITCSRNWKRQVAQMGIQLATSCYQSPSEEDARTIACYVYLWCQVLMIEYEASVRWYVIWHGCSCYFQTKWCIGKHHIVHIGITTLAYHRLYLKLEMFESATLLHESLYRHLEAGMNEWGV